MGLNKDVITEILLRLPVKSVLRFKSVCKTWCNIINSSTFRKCHSRNQLDEEDDDTLFLQFRESSWTLSSFLFPKNWRSYNEFPAAFQKFINENARVGGRWVDDNLIFDGPINGLICMYDRRPVKSDLELEWSLSIAICNPCLGEIKIVPQSPGCSYLLDTWGDATSSRNVGFGFDFVTNDYKIVQLIWHLDGERRRCVEVYSSRTNTWREVATDIFDDLRHSHNEIKVIKSTHKAAYWHILKMDWNGNPMEDLILSFDMENEVFEMLKIPDLGCSVFLGHEEFVVLAKDDGSLVLFFCPGSYCRLNMCRLKMWELDKEGCWNRVRDVTVPEYLQVELGPIALWKDGIVLRFYDPQHPDKFTYWLYRDEEEEREVVELPWLCRDEEEEREVVELPNDRLGILEYKCTLYSL